MKFMTLGIRFPAVRAHLSFQTPNRIVNSHFAPSLCASINSSRSVSSADNGNGPLDYGHDPEPPIPPYIQRRDEPLEVKRARLLYQSRKRGMLENGLLLSNFAGRYLAGMSPVQLDEYDLLINVPSNDWDIYYWAVGAKQTPPEFQTPVMTLLQEHARNKDRAQRLVQPDLH